MKRANFKVNKEKVNFNCRLCSGSNTWFPAVFLPGTTEGLIRRLFLMSFTLCFYVLFYLLRL